MTLAAEPRTRGDMQMLLWPQASLFRTLRLQYALIACVSVLTGGCWSPPGQSSVTVYAALDAEFSQPILHDYAQQTGTEVNPKFDVESTKTVGLVQAIIAERDRPRCDVFWNNEIMHTLRLEKQGLLDSYQSLEAESYPAMYRSPRGAWHGFAARARVLIVNTDLVPKDQRPTSIEDLTNPRWQGRVGVAKPLFGTTATHAACLFAVWGDERASDFFRRLKSNVRVMSGNKQVAQAVAAGQLDFGLTDTDDAIGEIDRGMPVAIVYPDQQPDGLGTLFIPNTLAVIKGCPHPAAARRLIDYLLSPAVEARLAAGASAQIPLNSRVSAKVRVETPGSIKPMQVDFAAAAEAWQRAAKLLTEEFTTD